MNPLTSCRLRWPGLAALTLLAVTAGGATLPDAPPPARHRVVVFVWDGLRPDSISAANTPTLAAFRARGVDFARHHSVYPTLTMINAAALATGDYPDRHGFYGNTVWAPSASGLNSEGHAIDFRQPVFTEDFGVLDALDAAARGKLLNAPTLVEQAANAGLRVALVGKSGPVYLQDRTRRGSIVDEKAVFPLELARSLVEAGFALPAFGLDASRAGAGALPAHENAPASGRVERLADGRTPDPTTGVVSPYTPVNDYLMHVLLDYLWPRQAPDLTLVWLRDPDTTEHAYGPGSAAYRDALREMDRLFAALLARIDALHWRESTDILVLSDHGHSTISADLARHPLRALLDGKVGDTDPGGYSVSGAVRTADLLGRAGLTAYDGFGAFCTNRPIEAAASEGNAAAGQCQAPTDYPSGAHRLPAEFPAGSHPIVIALDGGSEYFYLPDHDPATARKLVSVLTGAAEYGPVFVDESRYGDVPGTLRLADARLASGLPTQPDVVVSFAFDSAAVVQGIPGIEYSSAYPSANRGMHGSLSPRDLHNVLIAAGPSFREHWVSETPSSNVDIAPTVAALLHLRTAPMQGRVLREALRGSAAEVKTASRIVRARIAARPGQGASALDIVSVRVDGRRYDYIDGGRVERGKRRGGDR
jgi:arylsulfatase A-like enzyme